MTIVLADDDNDLRELFTAVLEGLGYVVQAFADPVQALSFVRQKKCDLVMTDLWMPGMSGFELKERIENECQVPVLIMSAGHNRPHSVLSKLDLIDENVLAETINQELGCRAA